MKLYRQLQHRVTYTMFFFGFGLCIAVQDEYMRYPNQRDGRGQTRVLTHAFLCVINLMKVFGVHSVLEHQQQQLDFARSSLLSISSPDHRVSGVVRQGRRHESFSKTQIHPTVSLSSSQPGGPSYWVISLAFGLVGPNQRSQPKRNG